jgi:hypothetical protein
MTGLAVRELLSRKFIADETEKWAKVVRFAGMKVE